MRAWTCQAPGCRSRVRAPGAPPSPWRIVLAAGLPVCSEACEQSLRDELDDLVASGPARRRPLTVPRPPRGRSRER